jgi:hypothetical protein
MSGQQIPTDFRYPGEPEDGTSDQMQSWVDAGQDVTNFFGNVGDWFQDRTAGRTFLTPGGERNLGLDRNRGTDPFEEAERRGQFDIFKNVGSWWQGLVDEARANPPSTEDIIAGTGTRAQLDPLNLGGAMGLPEIGSGEPRTIFNDGSGQDTGVLGTIDMSGYNMGTSPDRGVVEETPSRTIDEIIALAAQYAPQGPDYSAARQQMMDDTAALNAQLQAMYSAAADRAGENVSRLGDIYGSAQAGIGAAYDTGTGNIEDAYASAQQQAADQMARLGIEAAAPTVIDPMALSQAESVSGLETGRAAGLSAANRYGATAQDFSSQMAQVLQQEGLGNNQALLAALQGRLGNLAMREAEAQGQVNPLESALQYLQLEQAMNPQAPGIDQDFELKRDQANVNNYWRVYDAERQLNPNLPPDELHQRVRDYIITGAMGEDAYNWVMQGNAPGAPGMPTTPGMPAAPSGNVSPNFSRPQQGSSGGVPFFSNIGEQFSSIFGR